MKNLINRGVQTFDLFAKDIINNNIGCFRNGQLNTQLFEDFFKSLLSNEIDEIEKSLIQKLKQSMCKEIVKEIKKKKVLTEEEKKFIRNNDK